MNVYATVDGVSLAFNGSFDSLGDAQAWWNVRRDGNLPHSDHMTWWDDDCPDLSPPDWTRG